MREHDLIESWFARARSAPKKVALADADDERVTTAAIRLAREGLARPILVGRSVVIRQQLAALGAEASDFEIYDVEEQQHLTRERLKKILAERARSVSSTSLTQMSSNSVCASAVFVAEGEADVVVAGSVRPTSEVLRVALQIIGTDENVSTVSSCFIMSHLGKVFAFGDCGVVPKPSAEQLADIAAATAQTYARITGTKPYVALLSFSTLGSAEHPSIDHVREAADLIRRSVPNLLVDGELQFDAAFNPDVARTKAKGSPVAGRANVFIFPDLSAANIGYKIAQQIGGASAYGPLIQGLSRPMHDVSRGCSSEDIVVVSVLGALETYAPSSCPSSS